VAAVRHRLNACKYGVIEPVAFSYPDRFYRIYLGHPPQLATETPSRLTLHKYIIKVITNADSPKKNNS